MIFIWITDPIDPSAQKHIEEDARFEIVKDMDGRASEIEVLITRPYTKCDKEFLDKFPKLKLIICACIGTDHVDCEEAGRRGIKIKNIPDASTEAVSEHVVGLVLALARNITISHQNMCGGVFRQTSGVELAGKTLGLVAFGRISRRVGEILHNGFGMKVIAFDPYLSYDQFKEWYWARKFDKLNDLLKMSDVISLHMPLTEETEKMINSEHFSLMKRGVILVNTARADVVDREALLDALDSGQIAGAALDVFWKEPFLNQVEKITVDEICKKDNVICTPHLGAMTHEAQERIGKRIIEILNELCWLE